MSATTVSRFLNGQIRLPEPTERRIVAAVERTGYRPNLHARRLSTGRTDTIGLVIPDIANPFFARLAAAAEAEADRRGLQLALFVTLNRQGRERDYLEALARNHVDGLIFVTNHADHGALGPVPATPAGIVIVDEDVPAIAGPRLSCDNLAGGRLAGRHLAELGHRQVAYLGPGDAMLSGRRRRQGLGEGLGPEGRVHPFFCDYTREAGAAAAEAMLAHGGVTAAFLGADEIAIGVLRVLQRAGIRVPDDLSLVGFDDVAPLDLFDPPLTAVRQPVEAIGRRAVEILVAAEDGPARSGETLLPVELMVRASCAPPARGNNERGTR